MLMGRDYLLEAGYQAVILSEYKRILHISSVISYFVCTKNQSNSYIILYQVCLACSNWHGNLKQRWQLYLMPYNCESVSQLKLLWSNLRARGVQFSNYLIACMPLAVGERLVACDQMH